ncbi:MAG: AI-2E family transporter [Halieaceae bacterium]|nr:AI-2E family transporter [Halieaceae bacterium]
MLEIFRKWYDRYFFEEESILLLVLLAVGLAVLLTVGDILAPLLAAIVLAYLMQGLSAYCVRRGLPQWMGVTVSFLVFVGLFFGFLILVLPLVWQQTLSLFGELPRMLEQFRGWLSVLPEEYPELISEQQIGEVVTAAQRRAAELGQSIVSLSLASIPVFVLVLIYVILVPLLVFFFLKDREKILTWLGGFLPSERPLLTRIWVEMNEQVSNYARGKGIEILIVGAVSYLAFALLGLNYAELLGLLVGLSVIIPYIGATVVTIPVALIALFQWGIGSEFYTVLFVYLVIQALDGNFLVPLLFSEAVNLHPVAIILAVLFFGGIWGMWGVFFAIPLATLVKAVINAWPRPIEPTPGL